MSDLALPAPRAIASRPADRLTSTATLVTRCLRLGLRNTDGLITALALPVMLMLVFVYLFGGALHTGTTYVNYVVPGVLLVCLGFGTGTTAVTFGTVSSKFTVSSDTSITAIVPARATSGVITPPFDRMIARSPRKPMSPRLDFRLDT